MRKREQEKLTKYEDTLSELRSAGWDPELHVITFWAQCEIPTKVMDVLDKFGVTGVRAEQTIRDLHLNAINWMDKCIDKEIELNKWDTCYQFFRRKRKREK